FMSVGDGGRRRRRRRGCNSSPPWLSGHGCERAAGRGRLSEKLGRERDHRTQRARKTAGKRALDGRHRRGQLDLARQCAFDDALRRGGGGGGGGGWGGSGGASWGRVC